MIPTRTGDRKGDGAGPCFRQVVPVTFPELFDLPVVVDLRTAGRAVGISIGTAYKLVHANAFPCPVMRLGHRYKVPTAALIEALHIDRVPVYEEDVERGAAFAERTA